MPSRTRSARAAFVALAQRPQVRKRVETGGVAALERDLQRVLADQCDVFHPQLVVGEVSHPREPAGSTRFAPTLCARAGPPQAVRRIRAAMTSFPLDLHDLPASIDVDVDGKRLKVFQWTLITGSWRNDWIEVRAAT